MELQRVEIWFTNGLFRAYPHVKSDSWRDFANTNTIEFEFGGEAGKDFHTATINMSNVNFMETSNE